MNGNCDYACITIYIDIITMTVVSIDVNWGLFYCACARLNWFSLVFLYDRTADYFALYGRVSFLCLSKEKTPKERISDMLALRVPCDARMNRRDVKLASAQTVTSRNLRLILCFSASLNGGFKTKIKDEGLKT